MLDIGRNWGLLLHLGARANEGGDGMGSGQHIERRMNCLRGLNVLGTLWLWYKGGFLEATSTGILRSEPPLLVCIARI